MPLSSKAFSYSFPCKRNDDADGKSGNLVRVRKLTRQRKLRYLSDQDIGLLHSTESSPESCLASRSQGGSDHWSSSAVPQPLPLPGSSLTRRPDSTSPNSGSGLVLARNTVECDAKTNTKPSSKLGRSFLDATLANAKNNLRVDIPARGFLTFNVAKSSFRNSRAVSNDDDSESISNLSLRVVAKSAPTSAGTSPVASPRRSSNVDFFDPSINFPRLLDNLKMLPAKTVNSTDHSPLCCPGSLSPYFNNKIQEGSKHHKFLSRVWPENSHVDRHPLPLPPRASPPPQLLATVHPALENSPSKIGQWQKGKLIGRGTFGSVYHATNLENGASCAMKRVDIIPGDPKSAECIKQLEQEIRILRQLRHPNIVQYYGSEIVGDHLYIYMEYVHPGSINKFMRERCGVMTECVVRNFTRHILSGLAYLHSTKTIHRDIKGANLLVNGSGIVKLADFGLAKILTGDSFELSLKGSPYWMAPEVIQAATKNKSNPDLVTAIDIWSLGCTVIEMLTGKPPWSEVEGPSAMFKALQHSPPIPETLSRVGKDFLQQCFQRDPADRPSAATLLKHAFVQNLHDQDVLVHPQPYPRGVPRPGDNSPSPTTKSRRDIISASMNSRIFNKIHNGTSYSRRCNTEESKHITPSRHSHVPGVDILQSFLKPGTLGCPSGAGRMRTVLPPPPPPSPSGIPV